MTYAAQHPESSNSAGVGAAAAFDVVAQGLRILRCTAHALAVSPGGLRFKPGARPWLDGLTPLRRGDKPAAPIPRALCA
jgi:hypothetical protein